MARVEVDPASRTARCQGGTLLGGLDAAAQEHGLAVPSGTVSSTGVGGLTLGGGFGWLTRAHGLSIDNLLAVRIVLADGRVVDASEHSHPDLFWAVRGGGGNFGVVTEFTFRAHPVGPLVNMGLLFWPLERGAEALRLIRDTVANLPPGTSSLIGIGMNAPPAPFVPQEHHFAPGHALILAGFGTPEEHAAVVDGVRAALPPLFDFVTPIPFAGLQQVLDDAAPPGVLAYERALYLDEMSDEAIDVVTEFSGRKASPMSFVPTFRIDGAFTEVEDAATAFGGERRPCYAINPAGVATSAGMYEADRGWVRSFWEALLPYARGAGSYVNFMVEGDQERILSAYGPDKYRRLTEIKAEYDPGNVFRHNANIRPAAAASPGR
jgi:FAD/FMN-containing dehydrogenase